MTSLPRSSGTAYDKTYAKPFAIILIFQGQQSRNTSNHRVIRGALLHLSLLRGTLLPGRRVRSTRGRSPHASLQSPCERRQPYGVRSAMDERPGVCMCVSSCAYAVCARANCQY